MSLDEISVLCVYSALAVYALAFIAYAIDLSRRSVAGANAARSDAAASAAPVEGRVFTLAQLTGKLAEITALPPAGFDALKKKRDIDRALPRLVAAVTVAEEFGYSALVLTARELGAGLIIEAGLKGAQ